MPGQIDVTIDPATDSLKNPQTTTLGTVFGRTAHWKIVGPGIGGFKIEAKNPTAVYPFTDPLPTDFRTELELKVPFDPTRGRHEWDYKIIWNRSTGAQGPTLDPKIAVNPIVPFSLAAAILIAVAAISGMAFLFKSFAKRKAK